MSDTDSIQFECPHCEKQLRVAAKAAGKRVRCAKCQTVLEVPAAGLLLQDGQTKSAPTAEGQKSEPNPFANLGAGGNNTSRVGARARKGADGLRISNETWIGIGATAIAGVVLLSVFLLALRHNAREADAIAVGDLLLAAKTGDDFRNAADERTLRAESQEAFDKIDRHRHSSRVQQVLRQALQSPEVETRRAGMAILSRLELGHNRGEVISRFEAQLSRASADPDETVRSTAITLCKRSQPTPEEVAMKANTEWVTRWTSPLYALGLGATYLLLGMGVGAWKCGWHRDFLKSEAWQFISILALWMGLFTIVWFVLLACCRGLGAKPEVTFYLHCFFVFLPTLPTVITFLFALPGWGIFGRDRTVTYSCSSCGGGVNMWHIYLDGRPQRCQRCRVRLTGLRVDAKS